MSRLAIGLRVVRLAFILLTASVRIKRAFRRSRRAFAKALREGGVPPGAVDELVREYDALKDAVLSVFRR